MRVIQEPHKAISDVWGRPGRKEDVVYRLFRYILTKEVEEGKLLYNTVTGALILLEKSDGLDIDSLPAAVDAKWDALISMKYLVPEDFDDKKSVTQLRKVIHLLSQRKDIVGYTIMPTSHCNARCFYCFESTFKYTHMSEETAARLVEYMTEHCNAEKFLHITWFGGEPTVGEKRIDQICEGLNKNGIGFSSFMYSNGYLFDDEMVKKAVDLWKLNKIQITLDGTEEVYNRVKAYKAVTGSPYQRVMENIRKLLDAGIYVLIRLNVDFHNAEDLKTLIGELAERFSGYENISCYVSVLFDDEGYETVTHTAEDRTKLEETKNGLDRLIIEKGIVENRGEVAMPYLKAVSCCTDNDASMLINPDGGIAKCDHVPYTHTVGTIWSDKFDTTVWCELKENKEFSLCECCSLYPICYYLKVCSPSKICNDAMMNRKLGQHYELMERVYAMWKMRFSLGSD